MSGYRTESFEGIFDAIKAQLRDSINCCLCESWTFWLVRQELRHLVCQIWLAKSNQSLIIECMSYALVGSSSQEAFHRPFSFDRRQTVLSGPRVIAYLSELRKKGSTLAHAQSRSQDRKGFDDALLSRPALRGAGIRVKASDATGAHGQNGSMHQIGTCSMMDADLQDHASPGNLHVISCMIIMPIR